MPTLQRGDGFAAPRDAGKEDRQERFSLPQRTQKLRNVIEQSAKTRRIAPCLAVLPRTAPIKKRYGKPRFAQSLARIFIPTGMTLNAVDEDDPSARRTGDRIFAVMTAIAIADGVSVLRENCRSPLE
jgi:hypothetical protein